MTKGNPNTTGQALRRRVRLVTVGVVGAAALATAGVTVGLSLAATTDTAAPVTGSTDRTASTGTSGSSAASAASGTTETSSTTGSSASSLTTAAQAPAASSGSSHASSGGS